MSVHTQAEFAIHIIEKAKTFGASLAGLANIASVLDSPSYRVYGNARWSGDGKSVLVIALVHPETEAALDWWDEKQGGSPGNRKLINIVGRLAECVREEFDIKAQRLPYHVEKGGIFLKDAAVRAGLGAIGANNLLITPEYGPCVRLRALSLGGKLAPTGPIDFSPCRFCDMPCRGACPQKAFAQGSYSRDLCMRQMNMDEANRVISEKEVEENPPRICVKYCRACELACPVGRERWVKAVHHEFAKAPDTEYVHL
ncbi:MAG: epoxyqueuosine reductase [Thermodesulfobacteriota bacterium]